VGRVKKGRPGFAHRGAERKVGHRLHERHVQRQLEKNDKVGKGPRKVLHEGGEDMYLEPGGEGQGEDNISVKGETWDRGGSQMTVSDSWGGCRLKRMHQNPLKTYGRKRDLEIGLAKTVIKGKEELISHGNQT